MRFQWIQAEWFRLLAGRLAAAGVRRVIVSPGSRSTPLVAAAFEEPDLSVVALPDERSAAFCALGQARATGWPTVLVRTSGTASAHDYPAVIEASEDHVPLIVISADRPFELQAAGAPQTTDQRALFGRFVRFDAELGIAEVPGLEGLARTVTQAVFRSRYPVPGPVHLNARVRKPLEPTEASSDEERDLGVRVDALRAAPRIRVEPARFFLPASVEAAAGAVRTAERGAVLAGPMPPEPHLVDAATRFLAASGFRLIAETSSQLRRRILEPDDTFDWTSPPAPDVAVLLGRHPSSRALAELASRSERLFTVHPHAPCNPDGRAEGAYEGPIAGWLAAVTEGLGGARSPVGPPDDEASRRAAWGRVDRALDAVAFGEAHVVRAVAGVLPAGSALCLGNSLPIRLFDRYVPALEAPVDVFTQRGVNGIDGLVSGAAGVAMARGGPTVSVVGDVSFLHDVGGLAAAAKVAAPFPIVVIDNGGGRIFEELPLARSGASAALLELFTTPHRAQLTAGAELFGVAAARVASVDALRTALEAALRRAGPTVVHAVVPERGARELEARIRGAPE